MPFPPPAPEGPQGTVLVVTGLIPRGDWDSGTSYGQGDAVVWDGVTFISISNGNENNEPSDTDHWMLLAGGGGGAPLAQNVVVPLDALTQGSGDVFTLGGGTAFVWPAASNAPFLRTVDLKLYIELISYSETPTAGEEGQPIVLWLQRILDVISELSGHGWYVIASGPQFLFAGEIAGEEVEGFVDDFGTLRGFDGSDITDALAVFDHVRFTAHLIISND